MKTLATAQLSTHQSAGDVIGSVNGAGVKCCGGSMAQQSASHTSSSTSSAPPPPAGLLATFLNKLTRNKIMQIVLSIKLPCSKISDLAAC